MIRLSSDIVHNLDRLHNHIYSQVHMSSRHILQMIVQETLSITACPIIPLFVTSRLLDQDSSHKGNSTKLMRLSPEDISGVMDIVHTKNPANIHDVSFNLL